MQSAPVHFEGTKLWKGLAPVFNEDFPTDICLVSDLSVDTVLTHGTTSQDVCAYSNDMWRTFSVTLRHRARSHFLYPIIIKNHKSPSKKCAQAVLRRFEFLYEWCHLLLKMCGETVAAAVVDKQRARGLARAQQRYRPTLTQIAETPLPPAQPKNLEEILRTPTWTFHDAVLLGSRRTTRVWDISGACVWLVPRWAVTAAFMLCPTEIDPSEMADEVPSVTTVEESTYPQMDDLEG